MGVVDRRDQAYWRERAAIARRGRHVVKNNGWGRSLVKGQKRVVSASKSEEKCPRHYASKRAAARRRS